MTLRKTLQHAREFFKLQPESDAKELARLKSSYSRVTFANIGNIHVVVFHNPEVIVNGVSSTWELFKQLSGKDVVFFQGFAHDGLAATEKLLLTLVTSSLPDPVNV